MRISPFMVMEVLERAKELESSGKSIIHLEIGEPDFDTPEPVKEAAARAIQKGDTRYTPSLGKKELREDIAHYYYNTYGVDISPERVIVTMGSSSAMLLAFSALLEEGGEIIVSNPCYACYPNFILYAGGVPREVKVYEEKGFKFHGEDLIKFCNQDTKALVINSPANPTGNVFSKKELEDIAHLGHYIISDEVYHGLNYEGRDHTILEVCDKSFVINSFSKKYAMTGWRLGYVIVPPEYLRYMQVLQQNFFISASSFVQEAGRAALKNCDEHVDHMVRIYNKRRQYLLGRLDKMGLGVQVEPTGAFYALANVKNFSIDSYQLAFELLDKAGVAVTPGIDFGSNGEGYLRISYANSLENIKEGMDRMESFFRKDHEI
ncbi:MAG: pyridoxal phosphate-dependent aminotransferase [Candidatus Syntrophonatronum acetioxidans]|uniref:Aminotransferase n=1 Tax=Candidatus Syntrophonatronum acetioxidans TaxID=1795816 RepID=A0A424YGG7_9FIRM|nr:MAG: pyridoxal phosphate-dependent aminotransferase [Candidatus Syntrophonatronum acetioxidans]